MEFYNDPEFWKTVFIFQAGLVVGSIIGGLSVIVTTTG